MCNGLLRSSLQEIESFCSNKIMQIHICKTAKAYL